MIVFSPNALNLLADLWNLDWTAVLSFGFEGGTDLTKVGFFSSVFERNCRRANEFYRGLVVYNFASVIGNLNISFFDSFFRKRRFLVSIVYSLSISWCFCCLSGAKVCFSTRAYFIFEC